MPAQVADLFVTKMLLDERLMNVYCQFLIGEFIEGARKGRFGWQLLAHRETADAAQGAVYRQTLDQRPVVTRTSTDLATKSFASQARSRGNSPHSTNKYRYIYRHPPIPGYG